MARDVCMRVISSAVCVKFHAHVYLHHIEGSYREFLGNFISYIYKRRKLQSALLHCSTRFDLSLKKIHTYRIISFFIKNIIITSMNDEKECYFGS